MKKKQKRYLENFNKATQQFIEGRLPKDFKVFMVIPKFYYFSEIDFKDTGEHLDALFGNELAQFYPIDTNLLAVVNPKNNNALFFGMDKKGNACSPDLTLEEFKKQITFQTNKN
jgi:hypothetical protein